MRYVYIIWYFSILLSIVALCEIIKSDMNLSQINKDYVENYNKQKANAYFGMFWAPPIVTPTLYDRCCNLFQHAIILSGLMMLFCMEVVMQCAILLAFPGVPLAFAWMFIYSLSV